MTPQSVAKEALELAEFWLNQANIPKHAHVITLATELLRLTEENERLGKQLLAQKVNAEVDIDILREAVARKEELRLRANARADEAESRALQAEAAQAVLVKAVQQLARETHARPTDLDRMREIATTALSSTSPRAKQLLAIEAAAMKARTLAVDPASKDGDLDAAWLALFCALDEAPQ